MHVLMSVLFQYIPMPDGVVYVVSGQSGGRGPFGEEGVKCMGESASTDYIKTYYSECSFAYVEVDSKALSISFVNVDGHKKFSGTLTNPFEHGIVDEIVDVVTDKVFDGKNRDVVKVVLEGTSAVLFLGMFFGFFFTFRRFFGCAKSSDSDVRHSARIQMDVSTRSNVGLMEADSSHFLDDRISASSSPDRTRKMYA